MEAARDVTVDVELTNRCNATCNFCPRDRTPEQGRMAPATFEHLFARVLEFRSVLDRPSADVDGLTVSFCGLGEPLLHSSIADYVERFRSVGLPVVLSSNASLLDEERGQALIAAGLNHAFLNVGAREADYDELYGLAFTNTRDNVVRFREISAGRCRINVVVVNHDGDDDAAAEAAESWRALGLRVSIWKLINRGGSLPVGHMGYRGQETTDAERLLRDRFPGGPGCAVPVRFHFVGWNGQHYLCSSDWEKRSPHGHVASTSFAEAAVSKLATVRSRRPVCRHCSQDPINRLAVALRDGDPRLVEDTLREVADDVADESTLAALGIHPAAPTRVRIPVLASDESTRSTA